MTSNDVIAAWKDQAVRANLGEQELAEMPRNPAGASPFECDPANCAGGMLPGTARTIGPITSMLSCTFACSETMWDGSCDFFTYGCC
jgi:mersacidin/lichenicidin family type 2 lantibiotic